MKRVHIFKLTVLVSLLFLIVLLPGFYCKQGITPTAFNEVYKNDEQAEEKGATDFEGAAAYEFELIKNPFTGIIPPGTYAMELLQLKQIRAAAERNITAQKNLPVNIYEFQGPDNRGGRTRALAYDVRFNGTTNETILAGSVSGGVYKSINNGASWMRKSPTDEHFSATCLAQDTRPGFQNTWYYGTGEASGNTASGAGAIYAGNGIYKSVDNGETFTRLVNSNTSELETVTVPEDIITGIIVNPVNGDVYAACNGAIRRSQDGGETWVTVIGSFGGATDIVVTGNGRLYAAFNGSSIIEGVWTSTTGNENEWIKIAGADAATTPPGWNAKGSYGRLVLGIAPSQQNIVYALYRTNVVQCNGATPPEAELFRWNLNTNSWADLSANLPGCGNTLSSFNAQGGYNLTVAVKPDDANVVLIGGTNMYRSLDAFNTPANTTQIGGYNTANSHPDIHVFAFQPGAPNIMITGNDGGLQKTNNITAPTVAWAQISRGYRTLQYYYVTTDPRAGNIKAIGGTQDNGTTRNNLNGVSTDVDFIFGGDGVSVGLSHVIADITYEYGGSQNGAISRKQANSNSTVNIRPITAVTDGLFVTLFYLDPDNTELLYYANDSSLYRNNAASTATRTNWTILQGVTNTIAQGLNTNAPKVRSLATTRGNYNAATASLFIGTNNARLYRLDDPANTNAAATPADITGANFPANGTISSIAVNPRNDDTVLITFSNYGINSVFFTCNANAARPNWKNVEGNLTMPSFRSSAIAVTQQEVTCFVGTSVGLYSAVIDSDEPENTRWQQEERAQLGNALVTGLALRPADNRLLVGTHGYGMWASNLSTPAAPLPLNWGSFTGTVHSNYNLLLWQTFNEQNNKGFELERRYNEQAAFEKITFIEGKNSSQKNSYQWYDYTSNKNAAVIYYRLKQIDKDDKFSYSPIISLKTKTANKFIEHVTVTPAQLIIKTGGSNVSKKISISIIDAGGRLIKKFNKFYETTPVDISGLSPGLYVIKINDGAGNAFAQQFLK
jgi:Secretion system C-terminal sorting domain